jgi:hypothetical protein
MIEILKSMLMSGELSIDPSPALCLEVQFVTADVGFLFEPEVEVLWLQKKELVDP